MQVKIWLGLPGRAWPSVKAQCRLEAQEKKYEVGFEDGKADQGEKSLGKRAERFIPEAYEARTEVNAGVDD